MQMCTDSMIIIDFHVHDVKSLWLSIEAALGEKSLY